MKRPVWDYHFKCINPVDFTVVFSFAVTSKLMTMGFYKAKRALKRKKNLKVDGDISNIERFEVPGYYLKLLANAVRSPYNEVRGRLKGKGIILLDYNVDKGTYERRGDKWVLCLHLSGKYHQEEVKND